MKNSAIVLFIISFVAVSMMASFHPVDALVSVNEDSSKTTITLNDSVDFWVDVNPSSRINWYCDNVLVKSEYSSHSNYTFTPKATGTYMIQLSVDGFTKPSGPTKVTVIAAPISSPASTQLLKPSPTPAIVVAPTPYTTYHKGDSYTTVYSPSEITPPNGTKPPIITITYPISGTRIALSNLTLTFNLTLEGLHPITLKSVICKPSWQSDTITLSIDSSNQLVNKTLQFSINMNNIPDGEQSITIYAKTMCEFETGRESVAKPVSGINGIPPYGNYVYVYSNYYFDKGSSSIDFTVDTSPTITPSSTSDNISDFDIVTGIFLHGSEITVLVVFAIALIAVVYLKQHYRNVNLKH